MASLINLLKTAFSSTILIYSSILAALGTIFTISVTYSMSPTCFNHFLLSNSAVTVVKSILVPFSDKKSITSNILALLSE